MKLVWFLVFVVFFEVSVCLPVQSSQKNGSTSFFGGFDSLITALNSVNISGKDIEFHRRHLRLAVFVGFETVLYMKTLGLEKQIDQINHIILFVSQIQAIYRRSSLAGQLDISLVKISFHNEPVFDTMRGHRDKLLDSFCTFQEQHREVNDVYDMALYITALDLFVEDSSGNKNFVSLGLSPIGGVCSPKDNCVIAEFGSKNLWGQPYPSSGFGSTWVASHEMAHNLGIFHDGQGINTCPNNGFIMSSSRGTKGENTWSVCSAKIFSLVQHKCLVIKNESSFYTLVELPGQVIDAHDQCKFFLSSKEAFMYQPNPQNDICSNTVYCRASNLIGYYTAGSALEGTPCGKGKLCIDSKCQLLGDPLEEVAGDWTPWTNESCSSGCLENSKGFAHQTRQCFNPKPKNTMSYCEGDDNQGRLCDDTSICSSNRKSIKTFANETCNRISVVVSEIDGLEGTQIPYEHDRPWRSCAVFCRTRSGMWYTPRLELNHMRNTLSPFFPDGTLCHEDAIGRKYYCQLNRCLPEFFDLENRTSDKWYFWNKNLSDQRDLDELREQFTAFPVLLKQRVM
jgi:hypothetical protein